uniref:Major facilitator superfamily (MFS) profile domain-containing protein n=1 Tax=Amblyomma maculatum TaxID=34609 RepID=G3MSM7_AMBMU
MDHVDKRDIISTGILRIVKVDPEEARKASASSCFGVPRKRFVHCDSQDALDSTEAGALGEGAAEAAGVDKCWMVAALAFVMTTMESASSRCSGFFYVGIMEQMGVDRGLASWPVSLIGSVNDFGGLVSGPLSEHFTTVPVLAVGSVLASAGVIASAFSPDITWLSMTLGIIHGFGLGIVVTMLQVIISMYFDRYRGTAHGIMFAGSTVSAFIYPYVLLFLRNMYGFRNSLLLFGAILMNMFAFSLAFREPPWVRSERTNRKHSVESRRPSLFTIELEPHKKPKISTSRAVLQNIRGVFKCAMFYVLLVTWLVLCYILDIFFATVVDLALDKGVSLPDAVSLIPYFSVTDLVGRVFLPLLADRKYLRRATLMLLNYTLLGVSVLCLPFTSGFATLLCACLAVAMFMGCGMTMQSVLMADYLGLERLAVGYSITGAICGPLLTAKPPFVGFFRDNLGSYDLMFWILGCLSLFVGLLWTVVSWFERTKVRNWELNIARNMPCTKHM